MTKDELIRLGARKVRGSVEYMTEFRRIYKEEYGTHPNCTGCVFAATFSKWAGPKRTVKKNRRTMASKNTFKLKSKRYLPVPFSGGQIITADSDDQLVLDYINFKFDGKKATQKEKDARAANFSTLPSGGKAKKKEKSAESTDYSSKSLGELRDMFPDIKAVSKKDFISQIPSDNA